MSLTDHLDAIFAADRTLRPDRRPLPVVPINSIEPHSLIRPFKLVKVPPRYTVLARNDRCFRAKKGFQMTSRLPCLMGFQTVDYDVLNPEFMRITGSANFMRLRLAFLEQCESTLLDRCKVSSSRDQGQLHPFSLC